MHTTEATNVDILRIVQTKPCAKFKYRDNFNPFKLHSL